MRTLHSFFPGLLLVLLLTSGSTLLVQLAGLGRYGISPLTLAIVLGAVFGNTMPHLISANHQAGLRFAQKNLLRAGVALYGFNLSIQQIAQVGSTGIGVDLLMVCSTLFIGWLVGTRILGLDRETVLLTSAGSAICGAAAIVATVPVLSIDETKVVEKTAPAVATVVLFGTLAMLLYPVLYTWLGCSRSSFGLYIGSTVHEVAQVVAIGNMIGDEAARTAMIAKMIRVMLLVPFLLGTSALLRPSGKQRRAITIPWFALFFILFAGINSLHVLPEEILAALRQTGIAFLAAAMSALGLDTTLARLRQTGIRTFILGMCLFAHLVITGAMINHYLGSMA